MILFSLLLFFSYCECFSALQYCSGCNCRNCMNTPKFENERKQAIEATMARNPHAWRPKFSVTSSH